MDIKKYNYKAIIVSAYYYDNDSEKYIEYVKNFIPYVECSMYIFVNSKQDFTESMKKYNVFIRPNINIIEKSIESFLVAKYDWKNKLNLTVAHQVQNEKINFIKIIVDMEISKSNNYYVWVDIDYIRNVIQRPFVRYFPDKNIATDKVYIMRTNELQIVDSSVIAGHKDVIIELHKKYYSSFDVLFTDKTFEGKCENVFSVVLCNNQKLFKCVDYEPNNWMNRFQNQKQFYMFNFLVEKKQFIVSDAPFECGLGNVLFQVCSAYGFACRTNRVFFLTRRTISSHSKKDYTNSIFRYFTRIERYMIENIYTLQEPGYDKVIDSRVENDKNYKLIYHLQNENYFVDVKYNIVQALNEIYNVRHPDHAYADYFIHVRRGDYLKSEFHNVNLEKYYGQSIEYIKKRDSDWTKRQFYVFSDDINWCISTNFGKQYNIRIKYVKDMDELTTLSYMANTKYGGIVSNSTFAWWGAWLNKNNKSIRIIPSAWNTTTTLACISFNGATIISV